MKVQVYADISYRGTAESLIEALQTIPPQAEIGGVHPGVVRVNWTEER